MGAQKGEFGLASKSISETMRVRYLLGLSLPAEREQIESEFFEDDDAFQEMLTTEDDLIDAYARGELAVEERQGFEKSFVNSLRGRDRVQFARAFSEVVFVPRPVDTNRFGTLLDNFKIFQSHCVLRTTTIAAVIVLVTMLTWLTVDRRRMINELSELRAESAELSRRTEAFQRSNDTERRRSAEIASQLALLQAMANEPRHREGRTTTTQRARHLPKVKNKQQEFAMGKAKQSELLSDTYDASLGNAFENRKITELPLNANNVTGLLSLQPGVTRSGYVAGNRSDQANIVLDGVDVNQPFNTYSLLPRNLSRSDELTLYIQSSLTWLRFQILLEAFAVHEDYRITIKTADGRPVTSVDWIEPLTPNQTVIDTPVISTSDLPSGDYVFLLMGKEADGSFIQVAEYPFKVIKYQ